MADAIREDDVVQLKSDGVWHGARGSRFEPFISRLRTRRTLPGESMKLFIKLALLLLVLVAATAHAQNHMLNRYVCLDTVVNARDDTGEQEFVAIGASGGVCVDLVAPLPLSRSTVKLLTEEDNSDFDLIYKMRLGAVSVSQLFMALDQPKGPEEIAARDKLIGAIGGTFQTNRDSFCSRHPDLFIFNLKLDGNITRPKPCETQHTT
jgi:hypothetical protein